MPYSPSTEAALSYLARGWSILPMRMAEKRPQVRWKRYQREAAARSTVYRWFRSTDYGVGVIFGHVSGGLASRDFDDHESYERWAEQHHELARTLPTVETRRGFHVYCNLWPESVVEARRRLGKPVDNHGAIALGDGELRADVGCYSILPPSTHPSGHVYRWSVPLPVGELPFLDACEVGFCHFKPANSFSHSFYTVYTSNKSKKIEESGNNNSAQQSTRDTSARSPPLASGIQLTVEQAIVGSLPSGPGKRHRLVFDFARRLKAVPKLVGQSVASLRPYVMEWHRQALPAIGTKPFEETWIDFLKAWEDVQHPYGDGILNDAFKRACHESLPDLPHDYEQSKVLLLAGLCRELQRSEGDQVFYLSCRDAGRLLEVSHTQANRWLFLLVADGVLEVIEKGNARSRKASQYRYLREL